MPDYIDMNTYQDLARATAIYPDISPDAPGNPYYPALGLAGEVGEYCNKLKKVMRDKGGVISLKFVGEAEKELGDVLWYLAACASELGLDLGTIAQLNIDKLSARQSKGTLKGSGDDR